MKAQLLGKIMREARDPDVWAFTTLHEVRELYPLLDRYLGRRRAFWKYLLDAWEFFLTGGAVLCGWELGHRTTDDLDLFTTSDDAMRIADATIRATADETSCTIEAVTTAPDFRRYELHRGTDLLIVDLVRDRVPQLPEKIVRDGIAMDSAVEIFVNKICALVGRSEVRDLVDLRALEERGLRVEDHLELAQKKDRGATAATLAWLLSTLTVAEDLAPYACTLEKRMLAVAKQSAPD